MHWAKKTHIIDSYVTWAKKTHIIGVRRLRKSLFYRALSFDCIANAQAAAVQGNFYESVQNFRGAGKKRGRPYFA
jgi:hypothetical protein